METLRRLTTAGFRQGRRFHLILLAALLTGTIPIQAGDPVRIAFLPPELEGRYTLGIFDSNGKLVRVLKADAPESAFRVGLNGLITEWDGRGDTGEPLPPGEYVGRGFVLGNDVEIEGVAFHFNDWMGSEDAPQIERVSDIRLHGEGDLIVLARTRPEGQILARFAPETGFVWTSPCPGDAQLVGAESGAVLYRSGQTLVALSWADGKERGRTDLPFEPVLAIVSAGKCLVWPKEGPPAAFGLSFASGKLTLSPEKIADLPGTLLATGSPAGIAWVTPTGLGLQVSGTDVARPIPLNPLPTVAGLAVSQAGVWVLASGPKENAVLEVAADGSVLRAMASDDGWRFTRLDASTDGAMLAVLEDGPADRQRLRVLKNAANPDSDKPVWSVILKREITPCADFGFRDGKLVAGDPAKGGESVKIPILENSLEPEAPRSVRLVPRITELGSELATPEGLPVVRISTQPELTRAKVREGEKPGNLVVYQGDGLVVEEFHLSGMESMMAFDCGSFELPAEGER